MVNEIERIRLFDIEVDNLTVLEAVEKVSHFLKTAKFHHVAFLNTANIYYLARDRELMEFYKNADLVLADGISIVWSSRLLGLSLKEKVAGPDLLLHILDLAARGNRRIFILKGSEQDIGPELRERLLERFPGLLIAGFYFPPYDFDIDRDAQENENILKRIQDTSVDMLIVSLGSPKGKKWIWRNRNFFKNIPICMEVGAATDYLLGRRKRAPRQVQVLGLEWLFRLCCEPCRLWKRNLLCHTYCLWVLVKEFFTKAKDS